MLLSLVAAAFMYVGVAVALTLIGVNGNAEAIAAGSSYVVGAVGGPLALGLYLARRRGWAPLRAARWDVLAMLLVNVVLTRSLLLRSPCDCHSLLPGLRTAA